LGKILSAAQIFDFSQFILLFKTQIATIFKIVAICVIIVIVNFNCKLRFVKNNRSDVNVLPLDKIAKSSIILEVKKIPSPEWFASSVGSFPLNNSQIRFSHQLLLIKYQIITHKSKDITLASFYQ